MTEFSHTIEHSPTDIFQEQACSFCGAAAGQRRVLVSNELKTAFVCEICAPIIAAQARDTVARQDEQLGRST